MIGTEGSKPVPATIGTFFGGLWALIAVTASPPGWRFAVAAAAFLTTAFLIWMLWHASRSTTGTSERLFGRTAYQIAVGAELLAIYVASVALPRFGWKDYLVQAVGIIVGLHFIGLWIATKSSRFLGIAGGMCAISAAACFLPAAAHSMNVRDFITGVGNGIVLWIGASSARDRRGRA